MQQYHDLMKRVLLHGEIGFEPRTEMHIIGLPGDQSSYDLRRGFPQMTTKSVPLRLPGEELFWKARGERAVKPLFDRGVHIWDANAFDHYLKINKLKETFPKHTPVWEQEFVRFQERLARGEVAGDLGPVYGYEWRHWPTRDGRGEVDQLKNVLEGIKKSPISRYHVLTAWNPADLPDQALGPCPMIHQFTSFGKTVHLNVYQRSCDVFLGVPFNISQDALLLKMIAKETKQDAGIFVHSYGNVHAYLGVDRGGFWNNSSHVDEFRARLRGSVGEGYMHLKEWYLREAGNEQEVNQRKDHVPFMLEQLSKSCQPLPALQLNDIPFFEAIQKPLGEVAQLIGYNPHKWDAKATMAA